MPKADWLARANNWYGWAKSSTGFFSVGGEFGVIPNFNFQADPNYSYNGALASLSEGQSYGLLYALLADDLPMFYTVFLKTLARHELSAANLATAKYKQEVPWDTELMQFMDREGQAVVDRGVSALKLMGWAWSLNYSGPPNNTSGLSSVFPATDGDVVFNACCLLAFERWGIPDFKEYALASVKDLARWCTRQAGSRSVMTMGPYRASGGFETPLLIALPLSGATVSVSTDELIFNTAGLSTGERVRLYNPGSAVMPGGLSAQDGAGVTWPSYFVRVVDSSKVTLHTTQAGTQNNTARVDISSTGSGTIQVIPYALNAGLVGTNPSYLFPNFFDLFARYDTENATVWNSLKTNTYSDITFSQTSISPWNMPTYLVGVNKTNGNRSAYPHGTNPSEHQLDAVRVAINMVLTNTPEALNTLRNIAQFNSTTNLWEPKSGAAGGIWRYWVDHGRVPDVMFGTQPGQVIPQSLINVATDTVTFDLTTTQPFLKTGDAVSFTSDGTMPGNLASGPTYFVRHVVFGTYTIHFTLTGATTGGTPVNITSQGTGNLTINSMSPVVGYFYRTNAAPPNQYQPFSPYGVAQILAYEYALNGLERAEAFWAQVPAWIKEQVNGSFILGDTDYYRQHCLGLITFLMAGSGDKLAAFAGYWVGPQQDVRALSTTIGSNYGGLLTNGTQWALRVKPSAYDNLSQAQKDAIIKTLPAGTWLAAA